MKIIFLDVDGVLAHSETVARSQGKERMWRWLAMLDEACVARLVSIIKQTDAYVVLCSAWRLDSQQRDAISSMLRRQGFRRTRMVGRTGQLNMKKGNLHIPSRAAEIQEWLDKTEKDVTAYIWLDDEVRNNTHTHPNVHISGGYFGGGMQDEHVETAVRLLWGGGVPPNG